MPRKIKTDLQRLAAFTSNDDTRYNLTSPHHDGEWTVATDGHRMFGSKRIHLSAPGFISREAAQRDNVARVDLDARAPEWRQIVPGVMRGGFTGTLEIPDWVAGLKGFVPAAFVTGPEGGIVLGGHSRAAFTLNLALLAPLAGERVCIQASDDLSPIVITPAEAGPVDPRDCDWWAVVMPCRSSGGCSPLKGFGLRPVNVASLPEVA